MSNQLTTEEQRARDLLENRRIAEIEARRLQLETEALERYDRKILPAELRPQPVVKESWFARGKRLWSKLTTPKPKLIKNIRPAGASTYDPRSGMLTSDPVDFEVYDRMIKQRGEVIEPELGDTPETLAALMSQAACDHEFPRVIVYPIVGPVRKEVLELLRTRPDIYPMYEYREANITNNDDLDSKSLIFKYAGQSHSCKPV